MNPYVIFKYIYTREIIQSSHYAQKNIHQSVKEWLIMLYRKPSFAWKLIQ